MITAIHQKMAFDRSKLSIMHTQKFLSVVRSFIVFPIFAMTMPFASLNSVGNLTVLTPLVASKDSVITTQEDEARKMKADAIDQYFASKEAPLEGYGMKFVIEAEKNNLDWRLLPAIAMRETTGGKFTCKNPKAPNNSFGWGSCKIGFNSTEASIEHIAKTISGNNERVTAYKVGMTSEQILKKYNPDSIIPGYWKQVVKIMDTIGELKEGELA